jgi:hypothetical protein
MVPWTSVARRSILVKPCEVLMAFPNVVTMLRRVSMQAPGQPYMVELLPFDFWVNGLWRYLRLGTLIGSYI